MARLRTREDFFDPLNHSVRFYSKGTIGWPLKKQIDNPPDYTEMTTRKAPVPGKSERAEIEDILAGLVVHFQTFEYPYPHKKSSVKEKMISVVRNHLIDVYGKRIELHEKKYVDKIMKWVRDVFEKRMDIKCRNCPANKK